MSSPSERQDLPEEYRKLLLMQWIHKISGQELSTTQFGQSGDQWQFMKYPEGDGFSVSWPSCDIEVSGATKRDVAEAIVERATVAVCAGELGEETWFSSGFTSEVPDVFGTPAQFVRNMGDKRVIEGWRRLSDAVLVEFTPEPVEDPSPLSAPQTNVRVFLKVPGGGSGPFSLKIAADALEFVRLICAFALGRPVSGAVGVVFPAEDEDRLLADERQQDHTNVQTLARNGIPLDPFAHLASLGGAGAALRYRGSLVAFDAAMEQKNPDVATILFVSSIEALLSPGTEWRKERLTARFIKAVLDYNTEAVDAILQHPNMEMALGFRPKGGPSRRRQDLLGHIYDLRSTPVHAGPAMALGLLGAQSQEGQLRVALMSDLAQGVILAFLTAPRSSLVGHPEIWPAGGSGASA